MTIDLIHRASGSNCLARRIWLLCVFRDEGVLLPYFIDYYRALGVTHFLMVDNLSEDDGARHLMSLTDINISVYRAAGGYRDARYGMDWVAELLDVFCQQDYCLVVDADELFAPDRRIYRSLGELADAMEKADANVVAAHIVDMYPQSMQTRYRRGDDFLAHSAYFDAWNSDSYEEWGPIYGVFAHKVGGVRKRVLGTNVCLHKFPFFKYDWAPLRLAPGAHFFQRDGEVVRSTPQIRLFASAAALLHFKFIKPDFGRFVARRIANNQDWNESKEYRSYLAALQSSGELRLFDPAYSRKLENPSDLEPFFNLRHGAR